MTINISRFVRITSGVGGASGVAERDLIGRFFTTSPRVSVSEVLEFPSADAVGAYFGTTSDEYKRALFYFGFVSKSLSAPRALGFSRYAPTAQPSRIFGGPAASLAALKAITAGDLTLTVDGAPSVTVAVNLSAATTMADAATLLQTAIRAGDASLAAATVTYDAPSNSFTLTNGDPGPSTLEAASGEVATALAWTEATGAVVSPGIGAQTIGDALIAAADVSTNFGSFAFIPELTDADVLSAAQWNAAQNVEYMASFRVTDDNLASLTAALELVGGAALTYAPNPAEYDEVLPMAILAATDYDRQGSAQTYMFQQAALSAKVTEDAKASELDALRVNYYGQTQSAGQRLAFYMRGVLQGALTSPLDMNTYANEIWLKDAARAALMRLLLSAPRVPANVEGRAQVLAVLQGPIDRALNAGVISTGKTLDAAQKAHVSSITGDGEAWRQIQNTGYWVDAVVVSEPGTPPSYRIDYVLVYSKDDAIRQIVGTHDLI